MAKRRPRELRRLTLLSQLGGSGLVIELLLGGSQHDSAISHRCHQLFTQNGFDIS